MKNMKIETHRFAACSRSVAFIGGLILLLSACSSSSQQDEETQAPVAVQSSMPVRQTFNSYVEAYGTLSGDTRRAQALTLPQAGQIVAAEVTPGRRVHKGQPLLRIATDPNTVSAYQQAVNTVDQARTDLARTQRLHDEKLATNAQLDAARKALADARSALAAQVKLGGAQAVATLDAPADGVVTALDVQLGERVAAGAKLIEFTPQGALAALLGVEPEQASRIHSDMPVVLDSVYGNQALRGRVVSVADAVDPQSHLVELMATVDDPAGLAAGSALSAKIAVAHMQAWAVPRDALLNDERGNYVFQVEHGKAHRVDVQVVSPAGDPVGVQGKLDARAPVITLGAYELSDGDAVSESGFDAECVESHSAPTSARPRMAGPEPGTKDGCLRETTKRP
jgi:RND family efflux transporter MFP subunit